jgi:adenylate cyclase
VSAADPGEVRRVPLRRRLVWGAAAGLAAAAIVFALSGTTLLSTYEARTLDWRQRVFAKPTRACDMVAVVLLDDFSIESAENKDFEGEYYPWPRDFYEAMTLFLKDAGAKAVVFDMYFADPSRQRERDEVFATAAKSAGNVTFAAKLGSRPRNPEKEALALEKARVDVERWPYPGRAETISNLIPPIPELAGAAWSVGFANVVQDPDNTVRRADLVYPYPDPGTHVGSLGFQAARAALGLEARASVSGRELRAGDLRVPLGSDGRMLVRYYGKEGTFLTRNAISIIRSFVAKQENDPVNHPLSVDPADFKDRVVIIGVNAAGLEDIVTAPVSGQFPGAEFHATVAANLIGGDFLAELPAAGRLALLASLGVLGGAVAFGLWKPLPAAAATVALFCAQVALACLAFRAGLVLDVLLPGLVLGASFIAATVTGYLAEGRQKREVSRAFAQYLSPVVIKDLLKDPGGLKLGGETREITVYFSDIQGFSTFSEGMSPQELVSFLNVYLTAMTDAVLDRRGVVDKYEGDAVMAFWGAPAPLGDHARNACLAVLDQRRALEGLNERFQAEGRPRLRFRAGLNLGPAVVGNMGSSRRFAYTAMGDTVNLASRLEGANKFFGSSVMMSDAVFKAAGDGIAARRLGRILVVGKSIPTTVHELLGLAADLRPDALDRLARYHEALSLLESGAAADAAVRFEAILQAGADPVVEKCLARAREIERSGTPWDGIWKLTEKG